MCGDKKCCPVLKFNKKTITLKDDFGGKVKLTNRQAVLLRDNLAQLGLLSQNP
jgi:hypothetical protein